MSRTRKHPGKAPGYEWWSGRPCTGWCPSKANKRICHAIERAHSHAVCSALERATTDEDRERVA